jgi:hypothetical protein
LWTLSKDVVARPLGEALVIVSLRTNQIYELNQTGSRIWQLRSGGASAQDAVATLVREFAADPITVERDISALEQELLQAGLIEVSHAD